jgi:pimeloyl-ACP methyl ester carboxylesterase
MAAMKPGPSWLYLHGFASGPASTKARAFVEWGKARRLEIEALDLRRPSLSHLRFSEIVATTRRAIDELGPRARVVLVGSSLGGLTACRVAEQEPRVAALFLMAPAFRLAERWRQRLGEKAWAEWRDSNALAIHDYVTREDTFVDFGFVEELARLDDDFPDVRVPTCIVHGRGDETVDVQLSRDWAKGRRHVRLVEVDDGHELRSSIPRILTEAESFFAPFGV